jgi:hypothetical protein
MAAIPPYPWEEVARREDVALVRADLELLGADVGVLKSDVGALKRDLAGVTTELAGVRHDVGVLHLGFDRLDERLGGFDAKLAGVREDLSVRLEANEHKIVGAFRGELNRAITSQTRSILVSLLGMVVATGSFMLAAVQLG